MNEITVAPEVETAKNCISEVVFIIKRVDIDTGPIILIFNRENNILYEYMDNIKDKA
jgi:hypothetical protein